MKKLNVNQMENLQGGVAFPRAFILVNTVTGATGKIVIQANCANGGGAWFLGKGAVFGLPGQGANILHLTAPKGIFAGFAIFGAIFILDCTGNGYPNVYVIL